MARVRERLNFKGTKAEFHKFIRTDPRFFPKAADEIGTKLMAAMDAIEPRLDTLFLRRPNAPYGVRRLDTRLEGAMTYGYYQVPTPRDPKGYYMYNASKLLDGAPRKQEGWWAREPKKRRRPSGSARRSSNRLAKRQLRPRVPGRRFLPGRGRFLRLRAVSLRLLQQSSLCFIF